MDDRRRDPESGKYTSEVTNKELLSVLKKHEPAGTSEIANEFHLTQQAIYFRLSDLEDEGKIESKDIGGNRIWMFR